MNRNILDFKRWFDDQMLHEIGEGEIQTARGADLFKNPAMEVAMYICYRQAYDPINKRDREEEVKHLSTTHSISPEEAEQRATTSATAA